MVLQMANIDKIQVGSTTYNIEDSSGLYVKKAGDTMTGVLAITSSNTGSANEGIRINKASNNWATVYIGGNANTTSGVHAGAYLLGAKTAEKKLVIGQGTGAIANSETYFYADNDAQISPHLRIGNDLQVKGTAQIGDHVTQQYNSTTQALDFIFS